MRDLVVMLAIMGCALWALRQPWVGVILWTNISLMSPHVQFAYGLSSFPVATIAALSTLTGLLLTKERQNPFVAPPVWALLAFAGWICVTLPFSLYLGESLPLWERSMKIFLMIFVTLALIDDRRKLNAFIWIIVVSLGYYGVKGGVFTLVTAGNYRVWGPGGFVGGNNEIALALVTTIPLMRFLQMQMTRRWQVAAMAVAMGLTAITVLGTYSRGAFVAIAAMSLVFWLKGRQKILWGVAITVLATVSLSFMPDQWWDRMDTMKTYEQDDSALGRMNAWWNAWNLALDRPFGGGFMIYFPEVFARYAPDPERVHAAHSIYFQVLGEHGFVGFFLFMLIGALTWRTSTKLIKVANSDPAFRWAAELGAMVQVSMIGFGAGGAFLSLAYFDLPYNLMVMAVLALHIVRKQVEAAAASRGTSAPRHPLASTRGAPLEPSPSQAPPRPSVGRSMNPQDRPGHLSA